jgi:hypothetical protein
MPSGQAPRFAGAAAAMYVAEMTPGASSSSSSMSPGFSSS